MYIPFQGFITKSSFSIRSVQDFILHRFYKKDLTTLKNNKNITIVEKTRVNLFFFSTTQKLHTVNCLPVMVVTRSARKVIVCVHGMVLAGAAWGKDSKASQTQDLNRCSQRSHTFNAVSTDLAALATHNVRLWLLTVLFQKCWGYKLDLNKYAGTIFAQLHVSTDLSCVYNRGTPC